MLGSFDRLFDFNRDGKLDSFEQTTKFAFLDEMDREEEERNSSYWLDDDDDDGDEW